MASRDADLGFTVLDSRKGDLAEFEPLLDPAGGAVKALVDLTA